MKYLMGIDNGGTFSKAAIFDENGQQISVASVPTVTITPKPGYTERDMEELWQVNAQAVKEAIEKSGINPADIAGVSFSGHGKGLYLVGKDGKPSYNGIISTDARAWAYVKKWKEDGTAKKVYEIMKPDIIDINMGCPVPKVAVKSQAGSALLKNPEKIKEIVKAVVDAVDVPVTGIEVDGTITVNGENVAIEKGETIDEVLDKIKSVADLSDISVNYDGTNITFKSDILGSNYPIEINCTKELAEKLGLEMQMSAQGTDAVVTATMDENSLFKFPDSTTIEVDGNNITLSASGGFEMRVAINEGALPAPGSRVIVSALDIGTMVIQMGANEGQVMDINIPEVSCAAMGLDKLNLHTEAGCDRAIGMCDDALKYISTVRSKLGAYANRMEHAVNSLNVTTENMTAALSRIEDVDMAKEMTTFTSQNVITQAANSMLAQANQMPEKVLQLLQ